VRQPQPVEQIVHCGSDHGGREPDPPRPQRQLVVHRGRDELVLRVLEHRADPPGQRGRPPPVRRTVGIVVGQRGRGADPPRAGPQQAAEHQRQGGLPDAVGAQDGQHLALPYREVRRGQPGRQRHPFGDQQLVARRGGGLARGDRPSRHPDTGRRQLRAVRGEHRVGWTVGADAVG
jgi:hypothetical protein